MGGRRLKAVLAPGSNAYIRAGDLSICVQTLQAYGLGGATCNLHGQNIPGRVLAPETLPSAHGGDAPFGAEARKHGRTTSPRTWKQRAHGVYAASSATAASGKPLLYSHPCHHMSKTHIYQHTNSHCGEGTREGARRQLSILASQQLRVWLVAQACGCMRHSKADGLCLTKGSAASLHSALPGLKVAVRRWGAVGPKTPVPLVPSCCKWLGTDPRTRSWHPQRRLAHQWWVPGQVTLRPFHNTDSKQRCAKGNERTLHVLSAASFYHETSQPEYLDFHTRQR